MKKNNLRSIRTSSPLVTSPQRLLWLLVASLFWLGLLATRLLDIQVVRGANFQAEADDNRSIRITLPAERGIFLDRFQHPLVWNERWYAQMDNPEAVFSDQTPISSESALQLMATQSAQVVPRNKRTVAFGPALAHVLGYVGPVDQDILAQRPDLDMQDYVGRLGLELLFDQTLQGVDGWREYEINARVIKQGISDEQQPEPGATITTELDPLTSEIAYRSLGNQRGSVVILDALTGAVVSLVSKPSFDPNTFEMRGLATEPRRQKQQQLQTWFQDEHLPFFNRAVAGQYPPGSVYKLVTALAGLETGAITPETTVVDEGILKVGQYEYRNWYFTQYGRTEGIIDVVRSLARSNDIFFYKTAEWITPNVLAERSKEFGLGEITGIELPAESAGLVPNPAWKEQTIGEQWYLGNTYHMGIGQGDLLVTPIQIARLVQTLAHEGLQCQPYIVSDRNTACNSIGVNADDLSYIIDGMIQACSTGGTAYPFFPYNLQFEDITDPFEALDAGAVACKTGTAEFGGVDEFGYRSTHGWWAGIVEPKVVDNEVESSALTETLSSEKSYKNMVTNVSELSNAELYTLWQARVAESGFPERLVMVVMVESDEDTPYKEGSRDAGPVAKSILDWWLGQGSELEIIETDTNL